MLSDLLKLFIYIKLGLEKWKFKWGNIANVKKKSFHLKTELPTFAQWKIQAFVHEDMICLL